MNERHVISQGRPSDVSTIIEGFRDRVERAQGDHRLVQTTLVRRPREDENAEKAKPATIRLQDTDGSEEASRDVEKGSLQHQSAHTQRSSMSQHQQMGTSNTEDEYDDEQEEDSHDPKRHAIYMSSLAPLIALPIALYTLLVVLFLLLLSPFCFCVHTWPLTARFHRFLSPFPRLELYLIFSSYDGTISSGPTTVNVIRLIFANILAPLYALTIAISAWVAAVFWTYTAILGNPDGKEERDDGIEAVLAVRKWWEKWLLQGLA